MRGFRLWTGWILGSYFGALLGIIVGYGVGRAAATAVTFLLAFLWIWGALVGAIAGGAVGGATVGAIVGLAQQTVMAKANQGAGGWVPRAAVVWSLVGGGLCLSAVVPILAGDLSPLIRYAIVSALLAGAIHWASLHGRLPYAFWVNFVGTLAVTFGGVTGSLLLAGMTDYGAAAALTNALTDRTALKTVKITRLTDLNGKLLFFVTKYDIYENAWWELWSSNGTPEGTAMVMPVYTGWNEPRIMELATERGRLFFEANGVTVRADAQSWKNKGGLWRTDGSADGTTLLNVPSVVYPSDLATVNGRHFFQIASDAGHCALWTSDAMDSEQQLLREFTDQCPFRLTPSDKLLYFVVADWINKPTGCTLWKSDGTVPGTVPVTQLISGKEAVCPYAMFFLNEKFILLAPSPHGTAAIWISDGTAAGTRVVRDLGGQFSFGTLLAGRHIYFSTATPPDEEQCSLWASDGTASGTTALSSSCVRYPMMDVNGTAMFFVKNPTRSYDLWKSDGTVSGTEMVRGGFISADPVPQFALLHQGRVFFRVYERRDTCTVWISDGTETGTAPFRHGCPENMISLNGKLFFTIQADKHTVQLWKSDGTDLGTVEVIRVN